MFFPFTNHHQLNPYEQTHDTIMMGHKGKVTREGGKGKERRGDGKGKGNKVCLQDRHIIEVVLIYLWLMMMQTVGEVHK